MKLKPLSYRIIVEPIIPEEKRESGLFIPAEQQDAPCMGVVLEAGKDCAEVRPNDHILYEAYSGNLLKLEGKEILAMHESDVIAIIIS